MHTYIYVFGDTSIGTLHDPAWIFATFAFINPFIQAILEFLTWEWAAWLSSFNVAFHFGFVYLFHHFIFIHPHLLLILIAYIRHRYWLFLTVYLNYLLFRYFRQSLPFPQKNVIWKSKHIFLNSYPRISGHISAILHPVIPAWPLYIFYPPRHSSDHFLFPRQNAVIPPMFLYLIKIMDLCTQGYSFRNFLTKYLLCLSYIVYCWCERT